MWGEDDLVAGLQSLYDLDGGYGAATQLYAGADCLLWGGEFEEHHLGVGIGHHRLADVNHVFEPLEFDRALDAQIRPGALGEGFARV